MRFVPFTSAVTAFALLTVQASAQWIGYPIQGLPRTADGKPNLSAPAPKMPDGKPDFSGVWEHLNSRTSAYYLDGIDIPWQPWAKTLFDQNTADNQFNNPESRCLPRGVPKADAFDLHKIVQTPDLLVILYEYQTTFRQIFLDGRELPRIPIPLGRATLQGTGRATRWWWNPAASTERPGYPDAATRPAMPCI
jgi:hypothetical protein